MYKLTIIKFYKESQRIIALKNLNHISGIIRKILKPKGQNVKS